MFILRPTTAELANTVDPDETAQNEPSHLNLQHLPSKSLNFQHNAFFNRFMFFNFADVILLSAFLALINSLSDSVVC